MMGLPCGEEIMIIGRTMWTQSTSVTDRRTDRRTDRITITDTVQTASHGKNRRTTFCRGGDGELTVKQWLDSIDKQKKKKQFEVCP